MPAIMDDPSSPTIYRVVGQPPFPNPSKPELPPDVLPRQVTLRDRQTIATVVPFASRHQVPASLLAYLSDQFAKEIEGGDTYPMVDPMPFDRFSAYWFQNFAGIMLLGRIESTADVVEGKDWSSECLGSFYIKPNYPGRSSHVCNGGFLVTDASRNRGVGRLMGESYLDWAPRLGYTYSVFNLVYETNVASCKIWDALGFKRIGRVKGCGNLKSYPDRLIDAIIYGRDLGGPGDGDGGINGGEPLLVSEERFDKIKFYLKHGRYPNGSDRAEKSRLRSAATHYKLLDNDVLMLKDKEVISDPVRQMDVSRRVHEAGGHAGINKTTATIAEKYHWSRIKETVSDVIRTCEQCKEAGKTATPSIQNMTHNLPPSSSSPSSKRLNVTANYVMGSSNSMLSRMSPTTAIVGHGPGSVEAAGSILELHAPPPPHGDLPSLVGAANSYAHPGDITSLLNPPMQDAGMHPHTHHPLLQSQLHHDSAATLASLHEAADIYHPIDPQIISQSAHHHHHHHHHPIPHAFTSFHPNDAIPHPSPHSVHTPLPLEPYRPPATHVSLHASIPFPSPSPTHHHQQHHDVDPPHHEQDSFQELLHDADSVDGVDPHDTHQHQHQHHQHYHPHSHSHDVHVGVDVGSPPPLADDQDAVDRDLDMLIEHRSDSEMDMDMDVDDVVIRDNDDDHDERRGLDDDDLGRHANATITAGIGDDGAIDPRESVIGRETAVVRGEAGGNEGITVGGVDIGSGEAE